MFKWACLAVASLFLGTIVWMINDIRLQVRQSVAVIQPAGQTINDDLPLILERTKNTSQSISQHLPKVLDRIDTTTETLADLAADIRQLKELAGLSGKVPNESIVAYASGVLDKIAASGGEIGTKKVVGKGLKNKRLAAEWVVGARKEALFLLLLVRSRKEMLERLGKTKLGLNWYIELPGKEPVKLLDWVKENHPESKDLP